MTWIPLFLYQKGNNRKEVVNTKTLLLKNKNMVTVTTTAIIPSTKDQQYITWRIQSNLHFWLPIISDIFVPCVFVSIVPSASNGSCQNKQVTSSTSSLSSSEETQQQEQLV